MTAEKPLTPAQVVALLSETLLTPAQVGRLFNVDPKTVTRWAKTGKLRAIQTPSGHRKFRESDVLPLLTFPEDGAA